MDSDYEAIDMAKCLMLLSGSGKKKNQSYECRTCKKSFFSFQALGGHRASHSHRPERAQEHKKRRFSDQSQDDGTNIISKSRSYKCSMCESEFSSGQALGGHMRKHRPLAPNCAAFSTEMVSFDLNFPPLERGEDQGQQF